MTARHTTIFPAACLLLAAFLLPLSCTKQEGPSPADDSDEIRISVGLPEASAPTKTTYQTVESLNSDGSTIAVVAYKTGTATPSFTDNATYSASGSKWTFGTTRYWSDAGGNLDFFAYYPATPASACVTVGTYAAGAPTFSCANLPLTSDAQLDTLNEFVFAFEADKGNLTGSSTGNTVDLTFHRPFARVYFRIQRSIPCTLKALTITSTGSVKIKNSGTCTCSSTSPYCTWNTSGSTSDDFVITLNGETGLAYPSQIGQGSYFGSQKGYLVLPQSLSEDIKVRLSYTDSGGDHIAETTLGGADVSWQAGYSYIYDLDIQGGSDAVQLGVTVTAWANGGSVVTTVEE